ncbi:hypothetical protein ACFU7T_03650 [Streptomyces sp. NPDC057555]|uniref:hypothetical protein n=1 Tax=Streptomyces sp. NPDC057555 TaxID=3346166 RepID=UPI0036CFC3D0
MWGAGLLLVAGCGGNGGGGGGKPSTGAADKALVDGVNKGCRQYLKPETVATALGHERFVDVTGSFRGPDHVLGGCTVNISATAGAVPNGPRRNVPYLWLEVDDLRSPGLAAKFANDACDTRRRSDITKVFRGPQLACGTFAPEPAGASLRGGRIRAYASEGRRTVEVSVEGVTDETLKQDREHAFQLLSDARAVVRTKK